MSQLKLDSPGRRKIKYCPCGKNNRDGKFTPFTGHDAFGHCHGCDITLFPPDGKDKIIDFSKSKKSEIKEKVLITIIPNDLIKINVLAPSHVNLIKWLDCESRRNRGEIPLTTDQAQNIIKRYRLRGSNVYRGGVAFIYIDMNSNVRQIKVMGYDAITGKRIKEPFPEIMQIGKKIMVEAGRKDVNIVPCFFGEHLLAGNKSDVYIFESEATAIYASVFFPKEICIATGGKNGCKWDKPEQFKVLKGRRVVLWPDIDAHEEWQLKAEVLKKAGVTLRVEDTIVKAAISQAQATGVSYEAYKALKFDLRDILIYKKPLNRCLDATQLLPLAEPGSAPVDADSDFPAIRETLTEINPNVKFDSKEYKAWFDSVNLPNHPINLTENLSIYDAAAFVTGRLNHINAFQGRPKQGNRILFIHQLQLLRDNLSS
ncbi:DUF6965 family protein [Dyadobacter sp. CY323]|uniref:DUF6965 family protein n=1 Tax=Dyadobacter sp. CY323 TaxID=2907302 RepID=UPI001F2FDAF0|nr:DUF6371 domain-containing protein [Dyadobacter sp. CY323]MCE6988152.1 DUF6371 domain-containing protein [Dyadobacter sp. CY323]